ncbi:MAG: acetyl-CoA hydrolase/transferase C-terminal domain-containing protein [Halanaerobiales bacterium]
MDFHELYNEKLISIPEAVSKVESNQKVCTAMAGSEPQGLLSELGKHRDELENVNIVSCLMMGDYDFLKPEMKGHFLNETWFYGPGDRANHKHGNVTYIPNNLHEAGSIKIDNDNINIFWGTATSMDKNGFFSLSLGLTYEKQMVENIDVVVLEVNENLPWTLGDTQVHISDVDYVVENNAPLIELPYIEPGEVEKEIGENVAELIEDGSTLQLGIGGIPNAITEALEDKNDLGIHTEMFTDGMVDLFKKGVITNQRKTLWKGKMVGTFALGTQKLYDFIDKNLVVEFQQGKVTNDPYVLGQNHKMISVNTALQVDVTGQVCSEAIGNKHYSGTGGQVDTHRGAQRSEGGKGIIALRSTAKGGKYSTILAQLPPGSKITLGRNDIDYIVTEYGVAHLKGKSIRDRVDAMISIAHPDFRDEIREKANELKIW